VKKKKKADTMPVWKSGGGQERNEGEDHEQKGEVRGTEGTIGGETLKDLIKTCRRGGPVCGNDKKKVFFQRTSEKSQKTPKTQKPRTRTILHWGEGRRGRTI